MRTSIVYELSEPFKLSTKEYPIDDNNLAKDEIYAETAWSAVSTGTELAAWIGKAPLRPSKAYPRLMGYCNLAKVQKIGKNIKNIKVGDYILTQQSHRSAFVCNQKEILFNTSEQNEENLKKLATTYLYHIPYSALLTGDFQPGHQVAIIGMGTLGTATAHLLSAFATQPLIFSNQTTLSAHSFQGEKKYLFEKKPPNPEVMQNLCGMDGVDLVINTSDEWSDYLLSLQLVRKGGRVICLGFPGRSEKLPAFNPLDSQYLYDKQLQIVQAGYYKNYDCEPIDIRFTLKRNISYLASLILNKKIDPCEIISTEISWKKLEDLYRSLASRQKNHNSAIIRWNQ